MKGKGWRRLIVGLFAALWVGGALGVAPSGVAQASEFLVPPHLSWQHDPGTAVTMSWATLADVPSSAVRWGTTPGLEQGSVRARTSRFLEGFSGFEHLVELTGLQPGRRYYYSAGSDSSQWTAVTPFDTAPAGPAPFQFNAVADMGTSNSARATARGLASGNYNFTLHAGDISYAGGDQTQWDNFMTMIEPVASGRAYMAVPGNHENESRLLLGSFLGRFAMPPNANPGDRGRSGLYYSFNYSNVHFIGLEADNHGGIYPKGNGWDPVQTAWLELDLAAASKDATHPWIIVFFHFPPFSSSTDHGSWLAGRRAWSPLFDKYHVALVINGHDHDYERTFPVDASGAVADTAGNGTFRNPAAPIYVVTGGGGESHAHLGPPQPWSARAASVFEILRVQVNGGVLTAAAYNTEDGRVLDCFQILRGAAVADVQGPCAPLPTVQPAVRLVQQNLPGIVIGGVIVAGVAAAGGLVAYRRRRSEP